MARLLALFLAMGLVIQLVLLAIGALVAELSGPTMNWNAALLGCGVAWLAGGVGAVPVSWKLRHDPAKVGLAVLASTTLRFVTVMGLVAPLALLTPVDRMTLVVWVGAGYLLTLASDTLLAIHLMRQRAAEVR